MYRYSCCDLQQANVYLQQVADDLICHIFVLWLGLTIVSLLFINVCVAPRIFWNRKLWHWQIVWLLLKAVLWVIFVGFNSLIKSWYFVFYIWFFLIWHLLIALFPLNLTALVYSLWKMFKNSSHHFVMYDRYHKKKKNE